MVLVLVEASGSTPPLLLARVDAFEFGHEAGIVGVASQRGA
jgi:hypothetical protein